MYKLQQLTLSPSGRCEGLKGKGFFATARTQNLASKSPQGCRSNDIVPVVDHSLFLEDGQNLELPPLSTQKTTEQLFSKVKQNSSTFNCRFSAVHGVEPEG
ncbi:hypothetical protein TNIN_79981 [Trichonephila inaurata madagascariensis]|uniref:Uncharacterized protein n=1 Tax=Trichonephila inaurata madagascariensis TaxID=2747483 RepID=A0A8X7C0R7_9ARAC|nr:hypothetical protein TNIN_79981 [Trichonephila inaurata madagascariensis]